MVGLRNLKGHNSLSSETCNMQLYILQVAASLNKSNKHLLRNQVTSGYNRQCIRSNVSMSCLRLGVCAWGIFPVLSSVLFMSFVSAPMCQSPASSMESKPEAGDWHIGADTKDINKSDEKTGKIYIRRKIDEIDGLTSATQGAHHVMHLI